MAIDIPAILSDPSPQVCFVACHPVAGSHFADFFYELNKEGRVRCCMIASEKAAEELQKRGVPFQNFYDGKNGKALKDLNENEQDEMAEVVANLCRHAQCVITDLGQEFSAKVQLKLTEKYPSIVRMAYYDNPEAFVPGGYSTTAVKTIQKTQVILFANAKLANMPLFTTALPSSQIDLTGKQKIGLGYANLQDIQDLQAKRKPALRLPLRNAVLDKHGIKADSTLGVYFGGANEVYYQDAFPRFLAILSAAAKEKDLSSLSIIIQQHPRSVLEGNRDGKLLEEWKKTAPSSAPNVVISSASFNDALIAADFALYYQTGAASKFMLVGVPTAQIGHEPFSDILVRNRFCPALIDEKQFLLAFETLRNGQPPSEELQKKIASESGMDPTWPEKLRAALEMPKVQPDHL